MKVMKFGGTSVQDAAAIRRLMEIVKTRPGFRIVVVSALAGVTDLLLAVASAAEKRNAAGAHEILSRLEHRHFEVHRDMGLPTATRERLQKFFSTLKTVIDAAVALGEVSGRTRDAIAATGELCSSELVCAAFQANGLRATWWDSRELVATDGNHGAAAVNFDLTDTAIRAKAHGDQNTFEVAVAQGFIARDLKGATTTLGRGGSDYSAAIYGGAVSAEVIEIWTDVDGILTTDPRVVPAARRLKRVSFSEAAELATFGAKVLHPSTIAPAVKKNIPVWVLNSKNPSNPGTEITSAQSSYDGVLKAIAFKRKVTVINVNSAGMVGVSGFLKKVFDVMAEHKLSIDLISTSEVNISMTLDGTPDADMLATAVERLQVLGEVQVTHDRALISVVGGGMKSTAGVAGNIFGTLKGINILMISMGASELNLSFVVEGAKCDEAVQRLHQEFFTTRLPEEVFA